MMGSLVPIVVTLMSGLAFQVDLFIMCMRRQFEVNRAVGSDRWKYLGQEEQALYRKLNRDSLWITVIFVLCCFGIIYSVVQIIALHHCETSLWNVTGCVTHEQINKAQDHDVPN